MVDKRLRYFERLKRNHDVAIRIAFLHPDETVQKEITNEIYNISGTLNVNYQNGARRTCTITINNENNLFPIGWNGFWIGQKFQLWTGLYLDDNRKEPYYISQGIFYILNPKEAYAPDKRTITLQGVDKWAYLDGRLFGFLNGTYVAAQAANVNAPIKGLVSGLLKNNKFANDLSETENILEMVDCKEPVFDGFENNRLYYITKYTTNTGRLVYKYGENKYCTQVEGFNAGSSTTTVTYYLAAMVDTEETDGYRIAFTDSTKILTLTDAEKNTLEPYQVEVDIFVPPYTATMEVGKTFADIMLEYNTMLMGRVFYDTLGHLRFEAASTAISDFSDTDREIAWHFTITEQELLSLELESKFDGVFNDVIVLGAVTNGRQAKARVQNRDNNSDSSVEKIGLKTKTPYQSDQYYSDEQCRILAQHYAQIDMALEKAGTISSLPIYHLDVGQIVTVSTEHNYMSQEKYLVTGFNHNLNGTMSINVTNLRHFSQWTDFYTITYNYLYPTWDGYASFKTERESVVANTKKDFNSRDIPEYPDHVFMKVEYDTDIINKDIIVNYYYKAIN